MKKWILFLLLFMVSACLMAMAESRDITLQFSADLPLTGSPVSVKNKTDSPPICGIGFLWTPRSEDAAGFLNHEKDFVDLILGGDKLDVFQKVKLPIKVICLSLALERNKERPFPGIKETIEMLKKAGVNPERVIIGYNPERSPGTPGVELDNFIDSVRQAKKMSQSFGSPLLVGPGLREMQGKEDLYPELAKNCDIWLIQSQRLQLDLVTRKPVKPEEYREKVRRIVDILRAGNPNIKVFVQLVTTAERGTVKLTAEQLTGFIRSIEDIVDAVRIYGAQSDLLKEIITGLRTAGNKK